MPIVLYKLDELIKQRRLSFADKLICDSSCQISQPCSPFIFHFILLFIFFYFSLYSVCASAVSLYRLCLLH